MDKPVVTSVRPSWRAAHAATATILALWSFGTLADPPARIAQTAAPRESCPAVLRHAFTPIQGGAPLSLCSFSGKVLIVVNTASQCGYTPQYEELERLYRRYRSRGLVVVGFPSNDFGGQEPGSNRQIAEFCRTAYGIQFPMFEKQAEVKLAENPLYADLIARTGQAPQWNFHKYVIDRAGTRVASFQSRVAPQSREFVALIERLLAEASPAGS